MVLGVQEDQVVMEDIQEDLAVGVVEGVEEIVGKFIQVRLKLKNQN